MSSVSELGPSPTPVEQVEQSAPSRRFGTQREEFYEYAKLLDPRPSHERLSLADKYKIPKEAALADQVRVAKDVLAEHSDLYQRDGRLVEIRDREGTPIIAYPDSVRLLTILSDYCQATQRKKDVDVPCALASHLGQAIASEGNYPGVRTLRAITSAPPFLNGRAIIWPGWDRETGVYLAKGLPPIPKVSENPTPDEVEEAVRWLKEPFTEFEAVDQEMLYSVAASGIMTPIARWGYVGPAGPIHAFSGTGPAVGKNLAQDITTTVPLGRTYNDSFKTDEGQLAHFFLTLAKEGVDCVAFSNLDGQSGAGNGTLNDQVTSERVRGRLMRENNTGDFPFRPLWLINGNAIRPPADGARRWIMAKLTASTDRPQNREFRRKDLLGWVRENRGRILWGALTILRAYHVAGRPWPEGAKLLGGFEGWSEHVRFPLMWAGFVDPVKSQESLIDEGMVATEQMIEGIDLLHRHTGRDRFITAELHEAGALGMEDRTRKSVLGGKPPRVDNRPLQQLVNGQHLTPFGRRIKELAGRVAGNRRLCREDSGSYAWYVESLA